MVISRLQTLDDADTEPVRAPAAVPSTVKAQAPIVELPERSFDLVLIAAVVMLLLIGTVEVFSSIAVLALQRHGYSMYFVKRQLVWFCI